MRNSLAGWLLFLTVLLPGVGSADVLRVKAFTTPGYGNVDKLGEY